MTNLNTPILIQINKLTGEPLKKRGRKPKIDGVNKSLIPNINNLLETNNENNIVLLIEDNNNNNNNDNIDNNKNTNKTEELNSSLIIKNTNKEEQKTIKKRGRKPKGGKIIQQIISLDNNANIKPNVILHLKCSTKDLYKNTTTLGQACVFNDFISYNDYEYDDVCQVNNELVNKNEKNSYNEDYDDENNEESSIILDENACKSNSVVMKNIFSKLKALQHNLHINNINNKKSACFWCTYDFDNPPVYIPKHFIKETYEVYGCFCTPECATAYLMKENIDMSEKFERYHLLNNIYTKIYNYSKNIKLAPDPYYMLEKYYGNLTIQEYRNLLRGDRLFLVVDKPLTRILPELHEDNDDFIINNKIIPSNKYEVKKKLMKPQNKNNILNEQFGLSTQ
jgi:hypothetical protein